MYKVFIDTNILVYAVDNCNLKKRNKARDILKETVKSNSFVISTQVLQEFYVIGTTKLKIDPILAKNILHTFENMEIVSIDIFLIKEAIDTSVLNKISFWDALIIVSAENAKCEKIYTEDLNHGQIIRGVKIENPLL
ncbi:MAG: PIN domain-containing protein [Candidatus Firestonebacteria bacterium]